MALFTNVALVCAPWKYVNKWLTTHQDSMKIFYYIPVTAEGPGEYLQWGIIDLVMAMAFNTLCTAYRYNKY